MLNSIVFFGLWIWKSISFLLFGLHLCEPKKHNQTHISFHVCHVFNFNKNTISILFCVLETLCLDIESTINLITFVFVLVTNLFYFLFWWQTYSISCFGDKLILFLVLVTNLFYFLFYKNWIYFFQETKSFSMKFASLNILNLANQIIFNLILSLLWVYWKNLH